MSRRSNAHEQCVTRCPVFRLVNSPGRPASVISWKISSRDPGITILGSQLTGLAWLTCNRKVDFCCVYLRCPDLRKPSQPGSCNQALSFIDLSFYWPHRFFRVPRTHTPNISPFPQTTSYLLLQIKWSNLPLSTFSPHKYYQEEPKDNRKQKAQQHLKQVQV